ncbi:MAG TPA: hypothetical protein VMF67_06075 [Rhizomicrobium sp.]|nr:hypothetical protein [Rhizomicrobium sp.]
MKQLGKLALGAVMMTGTAISTVPAHAVVVGVGIGVPAPPCAYGPAYCGYYSYSYPVFIGGTWWYGPHYYRWWGGHPWIWWHGGWHTGFGGGWHGAGWHGGWHPGWGWHGGWHR